MKRIFVTLLIIFLSNPSKSQENKIKGPPENVSSAFSIRYPGDVVNSWKRDSGYYVATFLHGGKKARAEYLPDGQWSDTKTKIKKTQLPQSVKNAFDGSEFKSFWEIEDVMEMQTPAGLFYLMHIELNEGKMNEKDTQPPYSNLLLTYTEKGELIKKEDRDIYIPTPNDN